MRNMEKRTITLSLTIVALAIALIVSIFIRIPTATKKISTCVSCEAKYEYLKRILLKKRERQQFISLSMFPDGNAAQYAWKNEREIYSLNQVYFLNLIRFNLPSPTRRVRGNETYFYQYSVEVSWRNQVDWTQVFDTKDQWVNGTNGQQEVRFHIRPVQHIRIVASDMKDPPTPIYITKLEAYLK